MIKVSGEGVWERFSLLSHRKKGFLLTKKRFGDRTFFLNQVFEEEYSFGSLPVPRLRANHPAFWRPSSIATPSQGLSPVCKVWTWPLFSLCCRQKVCNKPACFSSTPLNPMHVVPFVLFPFIHFYFMCALVIISLLTSISMLVFVLSLLVMFSDIIKWILLLIFILTLMSSFCVCFIDYD